MKYNTLKEILSLYEEIGLSPIEPLRLYAEKYIKKKILRYENEVKFYERKYKATLEEMKNCHGEDFDFEDELMDWEFAWENLRYWQNKLKQLGY